MTARQPLAVDRLRKELHRAEITTLQCDKTARHRLKERLSGALDCVGVPGSAYAVQRGTDVQFTANLATLFTTNPPSPDGLFRWTDNSPPSPSGFYRLRRE